ncbi:glycosyltransferase family 4 protein [Halobacteriaceae archaeon GCM10025711]
MGGDHRSHGLVKEFPTAGDTVVRYCQGGSPGMYRALDLRGRVQIADGYEERRHLNPVHEMVKAPMLLGYPNLFASRALDITNDGLDEMLTDADVALVREPWQMPHVLANVDDETPVVYSSHNVETERFRDIDQPLFSKRVIRRVDELERQAVDGADAIICTSDRDARVYRNKYDPDGPIIVAPNGTYEARLRAHRPDRAITRRLRREYDIPPETIVGLFMGSNYRPNVEAAEAAVDVTRDLSDDTLPFHLLVVGSVGRGLKSSDLPSNVTLTGYVEEGFEAHFDTADIALNPMVSGGGTNIKLIDYFARSLPVVSTPFGARGLDVTDSENIRLAELSDFAEAIEALGTDEGERQRLGQAGRELAADRYTWEAASRKVREGLHEHFGPFRTGEKIHSVT